MRIISIYFPHTDSERDTDNEISLKLARQMSEVEENVKLVKALVQSM